MGHQLAALCRRCDSPILINTHKRLQIFSSTTMDQLQSMPCSANRFSRTLLYFWLVTLHSTRAELILAKLSPIYTFLGSPEKGLLEKGSPEKGLLETDLLEKGPQEGSLKKYLLVSSSSAFRLRLSGSGSLAPALQLQLSDSPTLQFSDSPTLERGLREVSPERTVT